VLHNALWAQTGLKRFDGFLCNRCIERHIGRTLRREDFPICTEEEREEWGGDVRKTPARWRGLRRTTSREAPRRPSAAEVVQIHRTGHDYHIIPVELLRDVRDDMGQSIGGWPGYFCVLEYIPAEVYLHEFVYLDCEPYAPPGGCWCELAGMTFPDADDARDWLETEVQIEDGVYYTGFHQIPDAHMPYELRKYRGHQG
jgi:hypothetical protein